MPELEKKLLVLSQIAGALNREHVAWAVGASLLLYLRGIVTDFHDIDIMVAEADVERAKDVLSSRGTPTPVHRKPEYKTRHFLEFDVDGVEVDLMAGFTIVRDGADHYFPLEQDAIRDFAEVNGAPIPLQSVASWRRYYELMGRADKVEMIDRHGGNGGVR